MGKVIIRSKKVPGPGPLMLQQEQYARLVERGVSKRGGMPRRGTMPMSASVSSDVARAVGNQQGSRYARHRTRGVLDRRVVLGHAVPESCPVVADRRRRCGAAPLSQPSRQPRGSMGLLALMLVTVPVALSRGPTAITTEA